MLVKLSIVSLAPSIASSIAPPMLNRDCRSLVKVRSARWEVLLRMNIALSFEHSPGFKKVHSASFAGLRKGASTASSDKECLETSVHEDCRLQGLVFNDILDY